MCKNKEAKKSSKGWFIFLNYKFYFKNKEAKIKKGKKKKQKALKLLLLGLLAKLLFRRPKERMLSTKIIN